MSEEHKTLDPRYWGKSEFTARELDGATVECDWSNPEGESIRGPAKIRADSREWSDLVHIEFYQDRPTDDPKVFTTQVLPVPTGLFALLRRNPEKTGFLFDSGAAPHI